MISCRVSLVQSSPREFSVIQFEIEQLVMVSNGGSKPSYGPLIVL